jgi:16S rRNA G1207 methylase RsmC
MASDHYFSQSPASEFTPRTITAIIAGRPVELTTAAGVFSPDHIDTGSQVLLSTVPAPAPGGELLDLGTGWGPIALTMASDSPRARVWAVDVNERALDLTRRNAAALGLDNVVPSLPDDVPDDLTFNTIWSNPPIRVGKDELHNLLTRWLHRLAPAGDAWLVVQRNLGSDSLQRWLEAELPEEFSIHRVATNKGFRVLRVRRRA